MNIVYKKLDEDDILEILIEHFQENELVDFCQAKACLLGRPGIDMRFVAVFSNGLENLNFDLEKVDREIDYNGTHSFLKNHSDFHLNDRENMSEK